MTNNNSNLNVNFKAISINRKLTQAETIQDIFAILDSNDWHYFDAVNLSTSIYRLAKLYKYAKTQSHQEGDETLKVIHGHFGHEDYWADYIHKFYSLLKEFKPQELANTAWAFATLNMVKPDLMQAIATKSAKAIGQFNPQDLANTAWAFAVLAHQDTKFLALLLTNAYLTVDKFDKEEKTQILLFLEYCRSLNMDVSKMASIKKSWPEGLGSLNPPSSSQLHLNILERLQTVYSSSHYHIQSEYQAGNYFIDIALWDNEHNKCYAIEVMGPSHYLLGDKKNELNGARLLKKYLLEKADWVWIAIPYFEWNALKDLGAKSQYLTSLLEKNNHPAKPMSPTTQATPALVKPIGMAPFVHALEEQQPVQTINTLFQNFKISTASKPIHSDLNPRAKPFVPKN